MVYYKVMEVIHAIPVSPGTIVGKAHVVSNSSLNIPQYFIQPHSVAEEQRRFHDALPKVDTDLRAIQDKEEHKITEEILETYLLIINDTEFHAKVTRSIESHNHNAEWAVHQTMKSYAKKLGTSDDAVLRERTKDIHDIMLRIIAYLKNEPTKHVKGITEPCIIVTNTLFASQLLQYPRECIRGIVLEQGGKTSHTAIVARALGIPMVVNASDVLDLVHEGQTIVLNAHSGQVILQANASVITQYDEIARDEAHQTQVLEEQARHMKHMSVDEQRLSFELNIDVLEELQSNALQFADGIGLFRTEFFLSDVSIHHSHKYQYEVYSQILSHMDGRPVTIRTIDIGGDKVPASMQQFEEENPLLGYRGIRFALGNRNLFYRQLQMLIKASPHGLLRILIPMVSTLEEFLETKELYEKAYESMRSELGEGSTRIEFGIMLEVPSLLYMLEDIAPHCDFWSIGTNDLLQYTMAADRNNASVSYLYSYFQPAFLRVLRDILHKAFTLAMPITMCGEMASDMNSIALLLGAGLRNFSVVPFQLSQVIAHATALKVSDARTLFEKAVMSTSVNAVQKQVEEFLHETAPR